MTATAVPTSPACPRCGRALPPDAPAGLCPRCLLSDGFGAQSEADYRVRTGDGRRFVPPTIEELASEFPNLEFVRPLGSGGMGAVYLAKQIRLDRPIAVKILPPDLADDPAFAERFLREARALARLSHPNIVGVFDFGQTPGGLYFFLMEYIEGPTLRQVVASKSSDPKQALEIVRQVCDALQYAHDRGVVHRDIKPENILLDAHGRVKIADFGLAKLLGLADTPAASPAVGSLTGTRQAMGTPHYMAPEQIVGSRSVDHRADIYSLGVVFYELLTGDLPLGRFAPPSKKVRVDVRLDEVVLRTLESEPAQRYQRAGDVRTAVDTISAVPRHADVRIGGAAKFTQEVERAAATILGTPGPGEVSRKPVAAFVWLATLPICVLAFVLAAENRRNDAVEMPLAMLGLIFSLPAATAPFGATILGVSAIREIRSSNGCVVGLVPAVAAAIAVPVLLLNLVIWLLCLIPATLLNEVLFGHRVTLLSTTMLAIPVWGVLDLCFVLRAWRRATAGLPSEVVDREVASLPLVFRQTAATIANWHDQVWATVPNPFRHASQPDGPVEAASASDQAVEPGLAKPITSRPSRKAAIGAIWAGAFPIGIFLYVFIVNLHPASSVHVHDLAVLLLGIFALPAITAPFATTILGWIAVSDVRRSAGRLTGLGLAVFDGLLFPLLVLDALIAAVLMGAVGLVAFGLERSGPGKPIMVFAVLIGAVVLVAVCVVVDTLIVRAVWRRVKDGGEVAPASEINPIPSRRTSRFLPIAAALLATGVGLFAFRMYRGGPAPFAPPSVASPTHDAYSAAIPVGEDSNRRWIIGPNGPELSRDWAMHPLGIGVEAKDAIDSALQDLSYGYERALDAHTEVTFDGDAVRFVVRPFPEVIDRLANEFYDRVDPLLNRDQQAILRYNLPLRYTGTESAVHRRYDDKLMPFGGRASSYDLNGPSGPFGSFEVRVERSGHWYRWEVSLPDMKTNGESPELPAWLFPWQERFEMLVSLRRHGAAINPRRMPLIAPKPQADLAVIEVW